MRGRFLKRLRTPAGMSFLALALLLGGGFSLVILDDKLPVTSLTSATSSNDLGVAEALVQVTPSFPAAGPTTLERVRPVLECVDRRESEQWVAYFGYQNANDGTVVVPVGADNRLEPAALDGAQPSSFAPGTARYHFGVTLEVGGTIGWSLQGRTATANAGSPECDLGAYDDVALPSPS